MNIPADILNKLNKLKAFIERDCGHESKNARDIADRLVKKYHIPQSVFSYTWWEEKQKADAESAARERAEYARRNAERAARDESAKNDWDNWSRVSYTSMQRDIVLALIRKLNIPDRQSKGKIWVYNLDKNFSIFSANLEHLKSRWARAIRAVNEEIISSYINRM